MGIVITLYMVRAINQRQDLKLEMMEKSPLDLLNRCPRCRSPILSHDKFCNSCGEALSFGTDY